MRILSPIAAAAVLSLVGSAPRAQTSEPPALAWPVACTLGKDCQIQRYMDHDPTSPGAHDYTCGPRTQDNHYGVDIRLPDIAAQRRGVAVLAAADGRVVATRNGMDDAILKWADRAKVEGVNCGNLALIDHGGGFRAFYCHMAKGSVSVKAGDRVKAGQPIGRIGYSGQAEFPHLHFELQLNGKPVDPFAYGEPQGACTGGRSLWTTPTPYEARVIVNTGFAAAIPTDDTVEAGDIAPPTADGALTAYVRVLSLKAGDMPMLVVHAPDGSVLVGIRQQPMPRYRSVWLIGVGRRRPAAGWPKGRYQATYTVTDAKGATALSRQFAFTF